MSSIEISYLLIIFVFLIRQNIYQLLLINHPTQFIGTISMRSSEAALDVSRPHLRYLNNVERFSFKVIVVDVVLWRE